MYEFLILAQLGRSPRHGYMIAKVLGNVMGPFRQAHWGALYPVLSRLLQEGLIEEVEGEDPCMGRQRKVYAITEAGRRRLHEHLMDTEHHLAEYDQIFPHKVACFSMLTPEERTYLARHYAVYAQQNINHITQRRKEFPEVANKILSADQQEDILEVMDHRIAYWVTERAWAEQLIAQEQRAIKEVV